MKNTTATLNHRLHSAPRPGFRVIPHGKHRRGSMSAERNYYRRAKLMAYAARKGVRLPIIQLSGRNHRRHLIDMEDWPAHSEWFDQTLKEIRSRSGLSADAMYLLRLFDRLNIV